MRNMCETCRNDLKMAEQWSLVAELGRQVILAEAEQGLSIPGAIRPLTDAEILAKVHFGDIEALQLLAVSRSELILDSVQTNMTAAIMRELGSDEQSSAEAAERIMRLLAKPPARINALIADAANGLTAVFGDVYAGATNIVAEEVERQQKRPVDFGKLKPPPILGATAHAIATQPWSKLADKVAKNHITPSAIVNGKLTREDVQETMAKVPKAGTVDAARQGIHTAHGAGRVDAADMQGASNIWSSELLDGRTCEPCEKIDGTEYNSMAAAKLDYPMGGYRECLGEQRCRGTLVFLYLDPQPGTGVDPDGNVTGQITIGPNRPRTPTGAPADTPPPAPPGTLKESITKSVDALNPDARLGGRSFRDTVTGMSVKHADNIEAQTALQKLAEDFAELVEMPEGYTMKAENAFGLDKQAQLGYVFYGPDGKYAGQANRIFYEEKGKFVAYHQSFVMEPDHQGHGISSRFLAASEQLYRKLGVEEIHLNANIDVGGYAWAKAGFDWKDWPSAVAIQEQLLEKIEDVPFMQREQLKTMLYQFSKRNFDAGTVPTPYDFAMFGYKPGAAKWTGKDLMLDTDWEGRKPLT